jgi:DNA-binding transcriptional LysR family regulator
MRQGLRQIEFLANPSSGEQHIGCPEGIMAGLLPAIAEPFSRRYPGIGLHVVLANTGMFQFQELRARNVELLVGRMPQPFVENDLTAEILFEEPFVAVAGEGSQRACQRRLRLDELLEDPWVLPPYDSVPGSCILEIFRVSKLEPPRPSIATLSAQLTVSLIASGRFVGLLPSSIARFNARRAGLTSLPMKLPAVRLAVGIITVKDRTLSPLGALFIDCAREIAKSIAAPVETKKPTSA